MYPTLETLMKHGQSNNKNKMSEIIKGERIQGVDQKRIQPDTVDHLEL